MSRKLSSNAAGFVVEHAFAIEAINRGYEIIAMYGGRTYDVLLSNKNAKFVRVQVKSSKQRHARFTLNLGRCHGKFGYTKQDCDIVAVYFWLNKSWYIFPVPGVPRGLTLTNGKNKTQKKYLNAWHYLKGK